MCRVGRVQCSIFIDSLQQNVFDVHTMGQNMTIEKADPRRANPLSNLIVNSKLQTANIRLVTSSRLLIRVVFRQSNSNLHPRR